MAGRTGLHPRRVLRSAVLLAVAAALVVVSVLLYRWSSPAESPAPEYPTLTVTTPLPVGIIGYAVDAQSGELQVSVELPNPGNLALDAQAGMATLALPNVAAFGRCPGLVCTTLQGAAVLGQAPKPQQQQPLIVKVNSSPLVAVAQFPVPAAGFDVTSNGVTAAAALPQVFYQGPVAAGTAGPMLEAEYTIPSAGSYDWSALPPQFAQGNKAWWFETFDNKEVAGHAAVGIDHSSQAADDGKIFAAGALIGLAGGALVWAVQEAFGPD